MDKKIMKDYQWTIFYGEVKVYDCALDELINISDNKSDYKNIGLENLNCYIYWGSFYVLEFNDVEKFKNTTELFNNNFKKKQYVCELEEDGNQFPKVHLSWEKNNKFFLFIEALESLKDTTNLDIGVVDWVIVNPELYLQSK